MSEALVGGGVAVGAGCAAWYYYMRHRLHGVTLDRLAEPFIPDERAEFEETPDGLQPRHAWLGPVLAGVTGLTLYAGLGAPLPLAASIGLALLVLSSLLRGSRTQRRVAKLEEQLTDSIDLIVASLYAGASSLDALDTAAREVREPLQSHLRDLVGSIRLGETPQVALENLASRVPLESFRLFTFALAVHEETGGSLAPTLTTVGRSVRDRIDIKRRIRSETTQAQASVFGILFITYAIGFVTWQANPGRIEAFLDSSMGMDLLAAAVFMQAVGIFWMGRLIRIHH
ncbi:MAG: type II secretion system F family protein [bacterium]|jgi:tight adherence protein B